jgi:hypothetical protein
MRVLNLMSRLFSAAIAACSCLSSATAFELAATNMTATSTYRKSAG